MAAIQFESQLLKIGSLLVVLLPEAASAKLPSRGMVLVEGTINDYRFKTPLEPDGRGSHWLRVDDAMQKAIGLSEGKSVSLTIESSKDWPEPVIPADIHTALQNDAPARAVWSETTPMARWDWIRWINGTGNAETRKRRIEVACSKLRSGSRRPCCFNRNMCCEPSVSKNGVLLEPVLQ